MRSGLRTFSIVVVGSLALTLFVSRYWPNVVRPERPAAEKRSAETTAGIDWTTTHGDRVLVLGDSFARDWFAHWGAGGHKIAVREGLALGLGDLDRAKADVYVEGAPKGTIVFYMAGPGELEGGSARKARSSADVVLRRVDAISRKTKAAKLPLVVGGPLPASSHDTDAHLVAAQKRLMKGLRSREDRRALAVMEVADSMTTAGQVTLVRGYAVPGEQRLSDGGYSALDRVFFPFMLERF